MHPTRSFQKNVLYQLWVTNTRSTKKLKEFYHHLGGVVHQAVCTVDMVGTWHVEAVPAAAAPNYGMHTVS